MSNNNPCLYPRTLSGLKEKYGDRCQLSGSYRVKAILDVENECCSDLPVLLTSVIYENGKEVFSAQCACGKIATRGCRTIEEAKELFHYDCISASVTEKENCYEFLRIQEIMEAYWLAEPEEEYVKVDMYFRKNNGEEQGKTIIWTSDEYRKKHMNDHLRLLRAIDILNDMEEEHEEQSPSIFGYTGSKS